MDDTAAEANADGLGVQSLLEDRGSAKGERITDARGRMIEVKGEGVVGEQPRLAPGDTYEYSSFCPLRTPWGTMEGSYTMRRDDGQEFQADIARFYLVGPQQDPR